MKLQQLRYIVEVVNNDLNVSLTSEKLYTSQPGISKQIKLLEDELGIQIFTRVGKHLSEVTPVGEKVISLAREILYKSNDIKIIAKEFSQPNQGSLTITTTYTQARYSLPIVIQQFMKQYPNITLHMEQGSSPQCIIQAQSGQADFAIVTDLSQLNDEMIALPCYHWNQAVIVKKDHPLAKSSLISIAELSQYPLVSYDFTNDGSDLNQAFIRSGQSPNIVFSTTDAELIKTYVKLGVGVGIVAKMAVSDAIADDDFVVLNAGHIFPYSTTYITFARSLFLRSYMYDFISQFSPHLNRQTIDKLMLCENNTEVLAMFNGVKLPVR
ncbi:transcriptional regulator CysB [Gilliamella apicola]|uniref:HTH-type transcriptional regulator CysB n=1 Tax=Gilliamella TaxID=1193503 RepID=UPI00081051BE|nr:HTH-type transcriptional regulator CysB [Gilliamella apicola]OCF93909.1 transcriptional regulator CysB [Gilliamella apicola]OTP89840.1 transcriptional regulator CysB [Gilliamella apicola]OTP94271.1 transcriptional regulator CysB [Gilliamella apicola]OTP95608.1 transcriptional regulator CysB [Gilliamella apicola]OTQ01927.1 transcriptional regulator CysB [Gilliamella apicola]